jgi:membrane-associated phospholipid phosphatase
MQRRSPRLMLLGAACFAAGAALVWAVAFETARGERLDALALTEVMDAGRPRVHTLAELAAGLADPLPFALLSAGVLAVAFARGGMRLAGMVGAVLVGAGVTSQVLKPLTADPRGIDLVPFGHVATASWPSGHATAAAALAFCLVSVAPARWRPFAVAAGGAFALAVSCSVLVLGWHFPSDVLGGVCVAAAWTLCGLAAAAYPRPM